MTQSERKNHVASILFKGLEEVVDSAKFKFFAESVLNRAYDDIIEKSLHGEIVWYRDFNYQPGLFNFDHGKLDAKVTIKDRKGENVDVMAFFIYGLMLERAPGSRLYISHPNANQPDENDPFITHHEERLRNLAKNFFNVPEMYMSTNKT